MTTPQKNLRVLVLEDEPHDATLINHALTSGGLSCSARQVDTREDFLRELEGAPPDLILSDHGLPAFDGFSALTLAQERCPDTPFVFVTGSENDTEAREARRRGASGWVAKSRLNQLVPVIEEAIGRATERAARRRAEEKLREHVENCGRLLDAFADLAVVMLDEEGRVASWNAGAVALTGYAADEIVGRHHDRLYRREDRDVGKPRLDLEDAATTGRHEEEGWRVRKDGGRFWARAVLTGLRETEQKPRGFVLALRDLSRQRQSEVLLRQQSEHYQRLFEACPTALVLVVDGRIALANEATRRLLAARTSAALIGKNFDDFVAEGDRKLIRHHFHNLATPTPVAEHLPPSTLAGLVVEILLHVGDACVRAELCAVPLAVCDGAAVLVTLRDLTAQELANDLRAQELVATALDGASARHRALLAAVPDAIVGVGSDGTITEWNPAAEKILGHPRESAVGKPLGEMLGTFTLTTSGLAELARHFRAHQEGELNGTDQIVARRRNGEKFLAELFVSKSEAPADTYLLFLRETRLVRIDAPPPTNGAERKNGHGGDSPFVPLHDPTKIFLDAPRMRGAVPPSPHRAEPRTESAPPGRFLRRAQHATVATAEARRSIGEIISQTRTPWGDVALLSRSQVEELERVMRLLEIRLDEREMALADVEGRLASKDRDLAEAESLLRAREQLLEAMRQQNGTDAEELPVSFSPEEIEALKQLKQELERQTASLNEAKAELRARQEFIEQSEAALFEKMQSQQEREVELEQRAEDLSTTLKRAGQPEPEVAAS